MRIALLTHQWPGARMGGIGSAVRQIAGSLSLAGHEVHVFTLTLPDDVRKQLPTGIIVHEVAGLAQRVSSGELSPQLSAALNCAGEGAYRLAIGWLLCDAMLAIHRAARFDIVEAPEVEALALPLLAGNRDLPVVTHLHLCTAISDSTNDFVPHSAEEKLVRELEFAAIESADGVCGPSTNVINLTRQLATVRSDVETIPYPFDAGANAFSPPPADGELLFIGRIERRKGVMPLTAALNRVLATNPHLRFCFAGPDTSTAPNNGSMRQWICDHLDANVAQRVSFTGQLGPEQVQQKLAQCRFCVLPSSSENFSVALCETMAAGRTAVIFDGTGSPEVLGNAGTVVPQGSVQGLVSAIQGLVDDRAALVDLSRRAYARIRRICDPTTVGRNRAAFYSRVIARGIQRKPLPAPIAALTALAGALAGIRIESTPGARLQEIFNSLGSNSGVWLYGAGKHTERLLSERDRWERQGHAVVGLIDDDPRFASQSTYLGLPVISLTQAQNRTDLHSVVLSTDTYQDQFWQRTAVLRSRGVKVFKLYRDQMRAVAA